MMTKKYQERYKEFITKKGGQFFFWHKGYWFGCTFLTRNKYILLSASVDVKKLTLIMELVHNISKVHGDLSIFADIGECAQDVYNPYNKMIEFGLIKFSDNILKANVHLCTIKWMNTMVRVPV